MAVYGYKYYIDGQNIAILQNYNTSLFPLDTRTVYKTPSIDDSSAIYLRYTVTPAAPTSVNSDLGLSKELSLAVVYYVKSRLAEDNEDMRSRDFFYNKFLTYIHRHQNNKRGSARISIPSGITALR